MLQKEILRLLLIPLIFCAQNKVSDNDINVNIGEKGQQKVLIRKKRFLNLFSIVKFPNGDCTSTDDGNYKPFRK